MNSKSKVLVISPLPPPAGGIATWCTVISESLCESERVEVKFINTSVKWRQIAQNSILRRAFGGSIQGVVNLFQFLFIGLKFQPDCIHINSSASLANMRDSAILILGKMFGWRAVVQYHVGFLPAVSSKGGFHWRWIKWNMELADHVLVLGDHTAAVMKAEVPNASVESLPNPIHVLPVNSKIERGEVISFLFLGHVIDGKGIFELAEACASLRSSNFRLRVVGRILPQDRVKLEGYDPAGAWLTIVGEVSRDEGLEELRVADCLALPSKALFEAFPFVILEAMALSVPVISTFRGAIPEMVGHDTESPAGIIVESGSVQDIGCALKKMISDAKRRRFYGSNGRRRAEELYSSDLIVSRLEGIWFSS